MLGQNVCYNHGGTTPAALAAAKRRLALAEAGKLLGVAKDVDPGEALLDAAQLAAGDVDALRRNLPDEMTIDTALGKAVDVRVKLYHEAIERSARLNKLAIDAGLAERLVRLRELEAAKIVSLLERLIDDPTLGLSPAQRAQARLVARRELLRLAGRNAVIELGDVRVIEGDTP